MSAVKDEEKQNAIFRLVDLDMDGTVDVPDLVAFVNTFGPPLSKEEEAELLNMTGQTGKNKLGKGDMKEILTKTVTLHCTRDEVIKQFKVFDQTDNGKIPIEVLVGKFSMFGDNFKSEESLRELFRGEYFQAGQLHYKQWVDAKFAEQS